MPLPRFVGIQEVKPMADGMLGVLVVTDFANVLCDREAYDVRRRLPIRRPEFQLFVCSDKEADILHRRY